METKIIKNPKFRRVAANVKPDAKRRIVLSKACLTEGVMYHVYCNEIGQVILDPQISIPASEAWIWDNPDILASLKQGLAEAAAGKLIEVDLKDL